jgi:hypothetical protein
MSRGLKQLGREVGEAQERQLDAFDLEAQRTRFLLQALSEPRRHRLARSWSAAPLAAAAVVVLALWWSRDAALSFRVAGKAGREDMWIAAPARSDLSLDFSDGSSVILDAEARARVMERSQHGARILLERGTLRARITHREGTRWRVDAGPFQVHVVGTAFELSWRDERFVLQLHDGAVRVVGPTLPAARNIVAGERLYVDLGRAPTAGPTAEPVPQVTALKTQAAGVARPLSTWRRLAAAGAHRQAFRALISEGFEALLRAGGASDLALAGDVARFAQHPAQARAALIALRARFPATPLAAEAAFGLGRLVFEQPGSAAEAARWFDVYLQEEPRGAFAREATGRLIECHVQLQHAERAERAAREYLVLFPDGPHAGLARALLGAAPQHGR